MATSAIIEVNGVATSIAYDGNPGAIGKILATHWNSEGSATELVLGGPYMAIGDSLEDCDKGDDCEGIPYDEYNDSGADYHYIFIDGNWHLNDDGELLILKFR